MRKMILPLSFGITVLCLTTCYHKVEDIGMIISIKYAGEKYVISTPEDLEYFVKESSGIPDLKLLDVAIIDKEDVQGQYKTVMATALNIKRDQHYTIDIPLRLRSSSAFSHSTIYEAYCVMTCGSNSGDGYCQQTVLERCNEQLCNCTGTGESAVIFPD